MEEMINKKHAVLYIDVTCFICKRTRARSYCIEIDGRFCCQTCQEEIDRKTHRWKNIFKKK